MPSTAEFGSSGINDVYLHVDYSISYFLGIAYIFNCI